MKKTSQPAPQPKAEPATVALSQPEPGKDRSGYTYAQLLAVQERQLRWWKELLVPEHYKALEKYCQRTNKPAVPGQAWPGGLHQIARGVALQHFLQDRAKFVLDDEEDSEVVWMRDGITPNPAAKESSVSD